MTSISFLWITIINRWLQRVLFLYQELQCVYLSKYCYRFRYHYNHLFRILVIYFIFNISDFPLFFALSAINRWICTRSSMAKFLSAIGTNFAISRFRYWQVLLYYSFHRINYRNCSIFFRTGFFACLSKYDTEYWPLGFTNDHFKLKT